MNGATRMLDPLEMGGMPSPLEIAEARAEKTAEQLRVVLLALASGGLTASLALHNPIAGILLVMALACVLRSWFLAKHRAIARRNALHAEIVPPWFTKWSPQGSWLWDTASAWLVVIGAALLVMWS